MDLKFGKRYGKSKRKRRAFFDKPASKPELNTSSTQPTRTPFDTLSQNQNQNQTQLSQKGIFGVTKYTKQFARPVKQVFDLDSDSDVESEDVLSTTPFSKITSTSPEPKPESDIAFHEFQVRTVLKSNQTETKSNDAIHQSPEQDTAFREFQVHTVLKLDQTATKPSVATTPLNDDDSHPNNNNNNNNNVQANKTLQFTSPPSSPIQLTLQAPSTTTASSTAIPVQISKPTNTTTAKHPHHKHTTLSSSSTVMQHTTLSRPMIPSQKRRRPKKRIALGSAATVSISTENTNADETEIFDLETLTMLPRPKTNKASNSLAVKVAALARQRVRAQRNSTSINRLRRSSIMPGRNSSIGGRRDTTSLVNLSSKRESMSSSSSRRSTNIFAKHRASLRRTSLVGGTTLKSTRSRKTSSNRYSMASSSTTGTKSTKSTKSNQSNTSRRSSSIRRSSIFTSGAKGGRRSSLVGGAPIHSIANESTATNVTEATATSTLNMTALDSSMQQLQLHSNQEDEEKEEEDSDEFEEYDFEEETLALHEEQEEEEMVIDVAAALQFVLEFVHLKELRSVTMFVDKTWSRSTVSSMSWSIGNNVVQPNYDLQRLSLKKLNFQYKKFQQTFPWGQFLCRGGFKAVYKVYCSHRKRMEAISVMDVNVIRSTNNQHIVRQEVHIGTLLSDLVTSGVSPNYIETYGMFQTEMEEPNHLWGSSTVRKPRGPFSKHSVMKFNPTKYPKTQDKRNKGDYCYIRMELCDGGDFEEFLKEKTNGLGIIPKRETVGALFQMISSLDLAQKRLNLRHYDIKLLNFFLKKQNTGLTNDEDEMIEIAKYYYDTDEYLIEAQREHAYIVKLADYGTADTSIETLNQPIDDTNFATLENTPPDFLLLGKDAIQTFNADTFALGLSAIHLLTGDMPYEEILEQVVCPTRLRREWTDIWRNNAKYSPLATILGPKDDTDYTLHDTLYRYFVLFGFPKNEQNGKNEKNEKKKKKTKKNKNEKESESLESLESLESSESSDYNYDTNPILNSVKICYRLDVNRLSSGGKGNAWRSYSKDRAKYGFVWKKDEVESGAIINPLIARGRKRMDGIYGMKELVESLCHYNPQKRISMHDAIRSDVFESLRM